MSVSDLPDEEKFRSERECAMKVAILITKSEFGGAQSHVLELIDGLMTSGHAVVLGSGDEGWLTGRARALGVRVTVFEDLVHPIQVFRDIRAIGQVRRWLSDVRPDLLHAHSSKAGLVGRIAAMLSGVPAVFTAHGWAFTEGASVLRKLLAVPAEWIAARGGGEIVCVSNYDRDLARRYSIAPDERLHAVWNGIDDVDARATPDTTTQPVVTMVARFGPQKDHSTLLRAAALVSGNSWRLQLVGDGPLQPAAEALASSLGISDRVDFLGARSDVDKLLAESSIFVLATNFEGLPISILEAMRAGLPVIASAVGGVPELVSEREGILVPKGDPAALRDALEKLLSDPGLRLRMGSSGRARYEKDFGAGAMLNRTLEIYKTSLTRRRSLK